MYETSIFVEMSYLKMVLKISESANGTIPGVSILPFIVWVFPENVCPYAMMQPKIICDLPLYPRKLC